jgi:hypothetical protein
MPSLPTSRAPAHVNTHHCPVCDDCGWLPYPYSDGPADYTPCPCCSHHDDRWTLADGAAEAVADAAA